MNKIKNSILVSATFILLFFISCDNDEYYYQDEERVRIEGPSIWTLNTDSLEYTFVTSPMSVTEFDMDVTLYIMGNVSDKDRVANIVAVDEYTTAQSQHFNLPSQVIIPANEYKAVFPVTLKRTEDLKEKGVRLYIKVAESEDFKIGAIEQNHLLLKWNDLLSRPKNWESLKEFFGPFSLVKYRFMINTLGVNEFDTQTMSWAQLTSYKIQLQEALDEYNAAHPAEPLKDEYGQYVIF